MDGQYGHENPLMSLDPGVNTNDFSYEYVVDPNAPSMAAGRRTNQCCPQSLCQWIDCPKTPQSYVEFLRENLENIPTSDVLESIGSPVGGIHAVESIFEIQRKLLHNNEGKAFSSGPDDYSFESEQGKFKLFAYATNVSNHEASASETLFRPHDRQTGNQFSNVGYELHTQQNHAFWMQEPNKDDCKHFQLQPKENVFAPSCLSQPHSVPKSKAAASDRQRRLRIAECIKALQELLPNSTERGQANILDDIIDHVKFLQLQIKELSRSRLGGEPTSCPFVFLEGYGHYLLHDLQEQRIKEPLEEMMGKLLEINPSAATQLLESRGLHIMPREVFDNLHRSVT